MFSTAVDVVDVVVWAVVCCSFKEWTGLEFGKSQRAVENREKWRKLVAKSSVVPQ